MCVCLRARVWYMFVCVCVCVSRPLQAAAAYQCLVDFSEARRVPPPPPSAHDYNDDERSLMEFHPDDFVPAFDLGPRVYESNTLTYQMFGFRGPLWMTQTCNDGSGCPFVQGTPGGSTYEQTNAWLFNSFGVPGQSYEEFVEMMRVDAVRFHGEMGGQRPWEAMSTSNVYMSYNDADPWTGPGVFQQMPAGSNLVYDLVCSPFPSSPLLSSPLHCLFSPPSSLVTCVCGG